MRENLKLLEKAENNPLLNVAGLVAAEDAQWNRDKRPQATIKEPVAPAVTQAISQHIGEIDDLVNPRLAKEVRAAVADVTYVSPETMREFCVWVFDVDNWFEDSLFEVRQQIDELQKKYDEAMRVALSYTPHAAGDAYREYVAESEAKSLETSSVEHCGGKTLEDFKREYRHKFETAMKIAKSFAPKARELVQPHIFGFVSRLRERADTCANSERRRCDRFHLPWKVSEFLASAYRAAEIIEQHNGGGYDPKSCAQFLDLSEPKD